SHFGPSPMEAFWSSFWLVRCTRQLVRDSLFKGTLSKCHLPPFWRDLQPSNELVPGTDVHMATLSPAELKALLPAINDWRSVSVSWDDWASYNDAAGDETSGQPDIFVKTIEHEKVCLEMADKTSRAITTILGQAPYQARDSFALVMEFLHSPVALKILQENVEDTATKKGVTSKVGAVLAAHTGHPADLAASELRKIAANSRQFQEAVNELEHKGGMVDKLLAAPAGELATVLAASPGWRSFRAKNFSLPPADESVQRPRPVRHHAKGGPRGVWAAPGALPAPGDHGVGARETGPARPEGGRPGEQHRRRPSALVRPAATVRWRADQGAGGGAQAGHEAPQDPCAGAPAEVGGQSAAPGLRDAVRFLRGEPAALPARRPGPPRRGGRRRERRGGGRRRRCRGRCWAGRWWRVGHAGPGLRLPPLPLAPRSRLSGRGRPRGWAVSGAAPLGATRTNCFAAPR
ncbi:unnamed protein product, partial [Prorocentrum cordatum]